MIAIALLIPIAYLIGAIPFGLIVGKVKGIDPRTAGSGNIGATNVGRLLGGKYFALVFLLDLLKGMLPTLVAGSFVHAQLQTRLTFTLWLLVGSAAILGHTFSPFLKFTGGKGVATGAGVALGVFPYFTLPAVVALTVFATVAYASRIVSLASITAAVVLPVAYIAFGLTLGWGLRGAKLPLLVFVVALSSLIVYRHRTNIARLRAGTEQKFGRRTA